jgi:hypothetical protein
MTKFNDFEVDMFCKFGIDLSKLKGEEYMTRTQYILGNSPNEIGDKVFKTFEELIRCIYAENKWYITKQKVRCKDNVVISVGEQNMLSELWYTNELKQLFLSQSDCISFWNIICSKDDWLLVPFVRHVIYHFNITYDKIPIWVPKCLRIYIMTYLDNEPVKKINNAMDKQHDIATAAQHLYDTAEYATRDGGNINVEIIRRILQIIARRS